MRLRSVFFWLHLTAGAVAGVVILTMSVTGVLLVFEKPITGWANRGYVSAPAAPEAARLSVEVLLGRLAEAQPKAVPSVVTVRADPTAPAAIGLGRDGTVFFDVYSGRALGEGSRGVRGFFRGVTDLHRWLAMDGEARSTGRAITGACTVAFLFLVLSGFYMWWPRSWTWPAVRAVTFFQRGLSGRPRDFNWHNVIGLWSAVPLFFVVLTGIGISYPSVYQLLGAPANEAPRGRGEGAGRPPAERSFKGLDDAWARAEQQVPGWKSVSLRLPASGEAPLVFTIDRGNGARPDLRSQLTLDRKTGAVVRYEPYASQSLDRQVRGWARWVHTGEAGGLVGQAVAGVASAGGAVLVWTGLALAWRRFRAWRARRAQSPARGAPGLTEVGG
jgi:uncharacterized iron-regulated membrane protein